MSQFGEPEAAWNVPAAHMLHEVALAAEYWPAAQREQLLEPVADSYLPAAHGAQLVEPTAGWEVPASHASQLDAPSDP